MKKRIVICADGTWNRPESDPSKDIPSNVIKFSRAIAPQGTDGTKQVVFYDWGIGSYHSSVSGGAFGKGLEKNVMDCYRFLVHNYEPDDEIFLFGFSRGAYTVRSLCGMINNCSILKGAQAYRVQEAFDLYKNSKRHPNGTYSKQWRQDFAVEPKTNITYLGIWDTVGAMGPPISFFGLIEEKHLFYDRKIGGNILCARHALSLDEKRKDFEPTFMEADQGRDIKQVWFAGVHSDIGGGYKPDREQRLLSNIPMMWMLQESETAGLAFEAYIKQSATDYRAKANKSFKSMFKFLGKLERQIPDQTVIPTKVHISVQQRWNDETINYRPKAVKDFIAKHGQWPPIES